MPSVSFRHTMVRLSVALLLWATPGPASHSPAQAAAKMALGAPTYQQASDELRIPVHGRGAPKFLVQQLASRQYVVDFADCELPAAKHSIGQPDESQLAGWSIAKAPNQGHARLRLTVRDPLPPRVRYDADTAEMVFSFKEASALTVPAAKPSTNAIPQAFRQAEVTQGARATQRVITRPVSEVPLVLRQASDAPPRLKNPSTPERKTSIAKPRVATRKSNFRTHSPTQGRFIGVPRFDAVQHQLVIPIVRGHITPGSIKTYRLNQRWSYIDIEGTLPTFSGVRYEERPDFKFQRWVSARRPHRPATRVSFASGVDVRLDVRTTPQAVLVRVVPTAASQLAQKANAAPPAVRSVPTRLTATPVNTFVPRLASKPSTKLHTTLTRPYYDEERFGLVFPYEGRVPLFRYVSKSANKVVLEFKAAVRHESHLQKEPVVTDQWGDWRLVRPAKGPFLHLEMNFSQPSELSIAADPGRRHLVLIPHPRSPKQVAAAPQAEGSHLYPVSLDQREENLFIPFSGAVPHYVIERVSPTYVYLVFSGATLRDEGVQLRTSTVGSPLRYALLSQPERGKTVRLAVSLAVPAAVRVFQDASQSRLVVSLDRHAESPATDDKGGLQVPLPWPNSSGQVPTTEPTADPV